MSSVSKSMRPSVEWPYQAGTPHLEQEENQEGRKGGGRKPGVTKVVRPVGLKYEAIGRQDPLPPPWEAMRGL